MLVWARSVATVSRYKAINVIIVELRFGMNCVKSDNFRSNGLKTLPGDLSRPSLIGTSSEARGLTLQRAGFPAVPEYRGVS